MFSRTGVSDCTCSGVYHTAELGLDQRGFLLRWPDPPLLVRPLPLTKLEALYDEFDPKLVELPPYPLYPLYPPPPLYRP